MSENFEGTLITIPTESGRGMAKVIFQSGYFADTICLKLFRKRFREGQSIEEPEFSGEFDLYYTSLDGFNKKRWIVVAQEPVSADEKALTKRTAGGEVWVKTRTWEWPAMTILRCFQRCSSTVSN